MPDTDHTPRENLPVAPGPLRWLLAETPASRRACLGFGWFALLALLVSILRGPKGLVYDEVFHLTTVTAFFRLGLSREFLLGTPWSTPGPLYAFVQAAGAPLTGLRPPGIRLVNFVCVLGMLALLWRALRVRGVSGPMSVSLGILAAPMGWIVFKLALTEAPAMCCAAGSVLLTELWLHEEARPGRRDALALGAGLLLGGAIIGRQVYLAALPAVVLLARRGAVRPMLLQLAAALPLPAVLFAVWGGLTPPDMRFIGHGVRLSSAVLTYADCGLVALLLAPRFFSLRRSGVLGLAGALLALNLAFGIYAHLPMEFLLTRHLPAALLPVVARTYGSVLLVAGALFIASALVNLWTRREDRGFAFVCAATLLLALTPLKITHTWDVRYVSIVLPFLVVALGGWVTHNFSRVLRLALGTALAVFYLHHAMTAVWDETHPPTMREIFSVPPSSE